MSPSSTTRPLEGTSTPIAAVADPEPPAPIDRLSRTDQMLKARYGVWIQTLKNHPIGIDERVFLSTFQGGRGMHITALDTGQARRLGERLIALADEIEIEVEAIQTRRTTE